MFNIAAVIMQHPSDEPVLGPITIGDVFGRPVTNETPDHVDMISAVRRAYAASLGMEQGEGEV